MEPDETVLVVNAPDVQAIAEQVVESAIDEIETVVETRNEIEMLRDTVTSQGKLLSDIAHKLDVIIGKVDVVEHTSIVTQNEVEEIAADIADNVNEILDAEIETQIEIAETLDQIDNDEEVDAGIVEEVLDTNDVIDAIIPEQKKERRRVRYI